MQQSSSVIQCQRVPNRKWEWLVRKRNRWMGCPFVPLGLNSRVEILSVKVPTVSPLSVSLAFCITVFTVSSFGLWLLRTNSHYDMDPLSPVLHLIATPRSWSVGQGRQCQRKATGALTLQVFTREEALRCEGRILFTHEACIQMYAFIRHFLFSASNNGTSLKWSCRCTCSHKNR